MKKKTKLPRKFHPWWDWECYKAGFFSTTTPQGLDEEASKIEYKNFLRDLPRFRRAMELVARDWPKSCEQFLLNPSMNRIA